MLGIVLQRKKICAVQFFARKKILCGPYVNEIDVDRFEGCTPLPPGARLDAQRRYASKSRASWSGWYLCSAQYASQSVRAASRIALYSSIHL